MVKDLTRIYLKLIELSHDEVLPLLPCISITIDRWTQEYKGKELDAINVEDEKVGQVQFAEAFGVTGLFLKAAVAQLKYWKYNFIPYLQVYTEAGILRGANISNFSNVSDALTITTSVSEVKSQAVSSPNMDSETEQTITAYKNLEMHLRKKVKHLTSEVNEHENTIANQKQTIKSLQLKVSELETQVKRSQSAEKLSPGRFSSTNTAVDRNKKRLADPAVSCRSTKPDYIISTTITASRDNDEDEDSTAPQSQPEIDSRLLTLQGDLNEGMIIDDFSQEHDDDDEDVMACAHRGNGASTKHPSLASVKNNRLGALQSEDMWNVDDNGDNFDDFLYQSQPQPQQQQQQIKGNLRPRKELVAELRDKQAMKDRDRELKQCNKQTIAAKQSLSPTSSVNTSSSYARAICPLSQSRTIVARTTTAAASSTAATKKNPTTVSKIHTSTPTSSMHIDLTQDSVEDVNNNKKRGAKRGNIDSSQNSNNMNKKTKTTNNKSTPHTINNALSIKQSIEQNVAFLDHENNPSETDQLHALYTLTSYFTDVTKVPLKEIVAAGTIKVLANLIDKTLCLDSEAELLRGALVLLNDIIATGDVHETNEALQCNLLPSIKKHLQHYILFEPHCGVLESCLFFLSEILKIQPTVCDEVLCEYELFHDVIKLLEADLSPSTQNFAACTLQTFCLHPMHTVMTPELFTSLLNTTIKQLSKVNTYAESTINYLCDCINFITDVLSNDSFIYIFELLTQSQLAECLLDRLTKKTNTLSTSLKMITVFVAILESSSDDTERIKILSIQPIDRLNTLLNKVYKGDKIDKLQLQFEICKSLRIITQWSFVDVDGETTNIKSTFYEQITNVFIASEQKVLRTKLLQCLTQSVNVNKNNAINNKKKNNRNKNNGDDNDDISSEELEYTLLCDIRSEVFDCIICLLQCCDSMQCIIWINCNIITALCHIFNVFISQDMNTPTDSDISMTHIISLLKFLLIMSKHSKTDDNDIIKDALHNEMFNSCMQCLCDYVECNNCENAREGENEQLLLIQNMAEELLSSLK